MTDDDIGADDLPGERPYDDPSGATDPVDPVADLTDHHDRLRTDLGGYVLGNLTLAEQQAVEAHLETCGACRDELAELEAIPVMLELARPSMAPGTAVGPGLAPVIAAGVLAAPRPAPELGRPVTSLRGGGGSRRRRVLAGAAGVLAVAAALVVGVLIGRGGEPDFGPSIALQPVSAAASSVGSPADPSGTAALRATDHGTAVRLDLEGLPTEGSWYECTWSSGQGEQSAGTFRPGADGSVHIDLSTAARLYPGWKLTIVEHPQGANDGEPLLEASA